MARVLALTPDLLFGSRVQGALTLAGHEVELIADEPRLRARLAERADAADPADPTRAGVAVLVVDLTDDDLDGAAIVESLRGRRRAGLDAHAGLLLARRRRRARARRAGRLRPGGAALAHGPRGAELVARLLEAR